MGNQEIAGFHFLARINNLHQASFFFTLPLSHPTLQVKHHHSSYRKCEKCLLWYTIWPKESIWFSGVPLSYGTGKCSAHFSSETIEHIQLSNAFKGTPRSPIDWGFWRSFSSFLTGSFVMWQLCWDKMPSVRPVMMYMYISDQLMSTTSSFRLNRLRQEEKKNILTGFRCLRFVTRSLYLEGN